jgi:hypothetical protein
MTLAGMRLGAVIVLVVGAFGLSSVPASDALAASVPKPPRSVRIIPGSARATVTWVRPSNGGSPIVWYEVAVYNQKSNLLLGIQVFKSTATTQVIVGLKNGTTYTFKVAAKNAVGWSKLSARSAPATVGVPSPPGRPVAVAGKNRATVSWTKPKNNSGLPVDGYRVVPILYQQQKAPLTFNSTVTTQVIAGLATGRTFTFAVAAHNKRGWSALSTESHAVKIK